MFAIPPAIVETVQNVNWNQFAENISQLAPAVEAARSVWTKDTLREMLDGNVAVPDSLINKVLAEKLSESEYKDIKSITVTSKANGKLDIMAETVSDKHIKVTGKIQKFVHNQKESVIVYKITDVPMQENGFMAWLCFNISMPIAEKILGNSQDAALHAKGNTITVDLTEAAAHSLLASREINGHKLIDLVEIQDAVPKDGYIAVKTKLTIPDDVKDMLKSLIKK